MDKAPKRLIWLAIFTFAVSPLLSWASVLATDETAVFASLSRMIWYSGSAPQIFFAMLVMFIPMLISFFLAHNVIGLPKTKKRILRISTIVSCLVLYIGAMWVMPSDGIVMTKENIWHGIMSFGGILMIFLTYCLYTAFIYHKDKEGAGLIFGFVLNVFDDKSYVIASAVSELYALTMMSLVGYLTHYLAWRKAINHIEGY